MTTFDVLALASLARCHPASRLIVSTLLSLMVETLNLVKRPYLETLSAVDLESMTLWSLTVKSMILMAIPLASHCRCSVSTCFELSSPLSCEARFQMIDSGNFDSRRQSYLTRDPYDCYSDGSFKQI